MALISTLINQVKTLLQDPESDTATPPPAWSRDRVRRALLEAGYHLARQLLLGRVTQIAGVAGTAQYSLPVRTVAVEEVLYSGRRLPLVAEESLALRKRDWERHAGDPKYASVEEQAPTTLRVYPQPVLSGSTVPVFPPAPPALYPPEYNLLVFAFEAPQGLEAGEAEEGQLPDHLEAIQVWLATAQCSRDDNDLSDEPKAAFFEHIAQLTQGALSAEA